MTADRSSLIMLIIRSKFMGHGTTLGGAIVDSGRFPWKQHAAGFPMFSQPDPSYHGPVYTDHFKEAAYIGRCRSVYQRTTGAVLAPFSDFPLLQGTRRLRCASGATWKMDEAWPNSCAITQRSSG
jgi:O-acetylhomoserine/O-acetylserine sulfhydrylase-like pyridoxal-dependent enzyme